MKTYTVTEKPFDEKLTTTRGIVYTAVQKSGPSGITREDFAKVVDGLMVLSGAYHRLNDLVKDGFVSVSGGPQKPWASGPEYRYTGNTHHDYDDKPFIRSKPKWKCPTCQTWVSEEIGKKCSTCISPKDFVGAEEA